MTVDSYYLFQCTAYSKQLDDMSVQSSDFCFVLESKHLLQSARRGELLQVARK